MFINALATFEDRPLDVRLRVRDELAAFGLLDTLTSDSVLEDDGLYEQVEKFFEQMDVDNFLFRESMGDHLDAVFNCREPVAVAQMLNRRAGNSAMLPALHKMFDHLWALSADDSGAAFLLAESLLGKVRSQAINDEGTVDLNKELTEPLKQEIQCVSWRWWWWRW